MHITCMHVNACNMHITCMHVNACYMHVGNPQDLRMLCACCKHAPCMHPTGFEHEPDMHSTLGNMHVTGGFVAW